MALAESRAGHMGELAVRITRMGTDKVWKHHVPRLVGKLAAGTLELQDVLTMRGEYFGEQPAIASMFQSQSGFGDNKSVYPDSVFRWQPGSLNSTVGGTDIRTINVEAGDLFTHPHKSDLAALGEKIITQMNVFAQRAPLLSAREIDLFIHKFYLLFSTLHLPTDGSGRLNGDIHTLLQRATKFLLATAGRNFKPHYISHTGYRMNGAEQWAMEDQVLFRTYLIADTMKRMVDKNPWLWVLGVPKHEQGIPYFSKAITMLEKYKKLLDDIFITKRYYWALAEILHTQIDGIFNMSSSLWINAHTKRALHRRQRVFASPIYYQSQDLREDFVPILDTAVSLSHYEQDEQLVSLLASKRVVSHHLMRSPIRAGIIREILRELKKRNRLLVAQAILENQNLTKSQ